MFFFVFSVTLLFSKEKTLKTPKNNYYFVFSSVFSAKDTKTIKTLKRPKIKKTIHKYVKTLYVSVKTGLYLILKKLELNLSLLLAL